MVQTGLGSIIRDNEWFLVVATRARVGTRDLKPGSDRTRRRCAPTAATRMDFRRGSVRTPGGATEDRVEGGERCGEVSAEFRGGTGGVASGREFHQGAVGLCGLVVGWTVG